MEMNDKIKLLRKKHGLTLEDVGKVVGVGKSTVRKWETGDIANMRRDKISLLANALHTTPAYLMGWDEGTTSPSLPSNLAPYHPTGKVPVLGQIPAGLAALAVEDIEGYTNVDVPDPENHFALRVRGDSMINAGIQPGDLVIIRMQNCAENGQIVACRVNGDEATLKRFKRQGDAVILMPENSNYEPIIVKCSEFDDGYASIIGVAIEIKRMLI